MSYKTISKNNSITHDVKKSKFICQIIRVNSEKEAQAYIQQVKKEHYKANHSCSAMVIGPDGLLKRSSDDGEPSGTAGIPMLSVLEKLELRNVLAIITRYFGGIKLGTGGLIRAYSSILADTIKETGLVEVLALEGLNLNMSYSQYQQFTHFLSVENLQEYNTEFLDSITTTLYLKEEAIPEVLDKLTNLFQGNFVYKKQGKKIVEIPIT